jgi:diguanylate cyclase (GGDEF)-like protein
MKIINRINEIKITAILRTSLLAAALIPLMVMIIASGALLFDNRFNWVMVLGIFTALFMSWLLSALVVNGLFKGAIIKLQDFCAQVKRGVYGGFDELPNQGWFNSEENEFISLMRDMNWMAHLIQKREQELRASITSLRATQDELEKNNAFLAEMAMTDPLTCLYNRRYFFDHLEKECAHMNRRTKSIALIILDIDHFKLVNDKYGHQIGDTVLNELSRVVEKALRSGEILARIGGEEFGVLIPDADPNDAANIALRICREVREHVFKDDGEQALKVTCSAGVTTIDEPSFRTADTLYKQADIALYAAKEAGRNRIYLYDHQHGLAEIMKNEGENFNAAR